MWFWKNKSPRLLHLKGVYPVPSLKLTAKEPENRLLGPRKGSSPRIFQGQTCCCYRFTQGKTLVEELDPKSWDPAATSSTSPLASGTSWWVMNDAFFCWWRVSITQTFMDLDQLKLRKKIPSTHQLGIKKNRFGKQLLPKNNISYKVVIFITTNTSSPVAYEKLAAIVICDASFQQLDLWDGWKLKQHTS